MTDGIIPLKSMQDLIADGVGPEQKDTVVAEKVEMPTDGHYEIEPGLGIKIRALGEDGEAVEWTITVEPTGGALKVIADTQEKKNKRRRPRRLSIVPGGAHNSVVLRGER